MKDENISKAFKEDQINGETKRNIDRRNLS